MNHTLYYSVLQKDIRAKIGGYINQKRFTRSGKRRWCCGVAPNQTKDFLWRACTAQPTQNNHFWSTRADFRSHVGLVSLSKTFPKNAPGTIIKWRWGGLHGRGMVHSSGVGAPMVPRGQVIHHQQRCRAQQRVITTISQLSWSGEFHSRVLRGGGVEHHRGHRSVIYAGDVVVLWSGAKSY